MVMPPALLRDEWAIRISSRDGLQHSGPTKDQAHPDRAHCTRPGARPAGLYAYLLDNGHLFYGGKVMEDLDRFEGWRRFKGGAILEVDWRGRIVWELRHPDHHHDARRLRNGNVILLCLRPLPTEIANRVQGGLPGTEVNGTIYGDYLVEMTIAGAVVWEWRSWEHLDPATHPLTL